MDGSPLPLTDSILAGVAPGGGFGRIVVPPKELATSNAYLRRQRQWKKAQFTQDGGFER